MHIHMVYWPALMATLYTTVTFLAKMDTGNIIQGSIYSASWTQLKRVTAPCIYL